MKKINIYYPPKGQGLEVHQDHRGIIADVFYGTSINHVCILKSEPNTIRGNHYHKKTIQHTLLMKGKMEYYWQKVGSDEPIHSITLEIGDLVTSEPNEIHTLKFLDEDSECVVFTEGPRGGVDYESDTFRVNSIV